jgi:hypothetical protein
MGEARKRAEKRMNIRLRPMDITLLAAISLDPNQLGPFEALLNL